MTEKYLFNWEEIPGKDSGRLIDFLTKKFRVKWAKKAKIEKVDAGMTINVSTEDNFLSLKLNKEKNRATLTIVNVKTVELIARRENDQLSIYYEKKYLRWKKCLICDDFVKLMFPEDTKDMLIIYEPVEGMSNASKNLKKRQIGYIHRACLDKAGSAIKK